MTPEFKNVLSFLKKHPNLDEWPTCIPFTNPTEGVLRLRSSEAGSQLVDAIANGEGKPVIISDAATSWPAFSTWTIDYLRQKSSFSSLSVRVNDRAPARHADQHDMLPSGGGRQSIHLSFSEYLNYMDQMPDSLDKIDDLDKYSTPFYLNGWRAFADIPLLSQDCPALPEFSTSVDDTLTLLAALDAQLFKSLPKPSSSSEESAEGWYHQVNENLRKVFICPSGCLTRLHQDAGNAHGWLAQIKGRKMFVLYPPSDTQNMHPLETEIETVQSPVDPLSPDTDRWPNIKDAHPVACILHPGEAVVIPQGWWHYAVALDKSITLQRNFYHAGSNAEGLVKMVLKTASSLKKK